MLSMLNIQVWDFKQKKTTSSRSLYLTVWPKTPVIARSHGNIPFIAGMYFAGSRIVLCFNTIAFTKSQSGRILLFRLSFQTGWHCPLKSTLYPAIKQDARNCVNIPVSAGSSKNLYPQNWTALRTRFTVSFLPIASLLLHLMGRGQVDNYLST